MRAGSLSLRARGVWPGALYRMPWYGGLLREWALHGLRPGQRVLELGCAGGDLAADLDAVGLEVVAVERSPIAAAWPRHWAPGVSVVCDDALVARLPSGTFDLVLASSLVNVVSDRPPSWCACAS